MYIDKYMNQRIFDLMGLINENLYRNSILKNNITIKLSKEESYLELSGLNVSKNSI